MDINIPYGRGYQTLTIPDGADVEVLASAAQHTSPPIPEDEIVLNSMAIPIGSKTLTQLAADVPDVTIICSDHTRPVPSRHIIPHMLAELRSGNPDIVITLLIATGFHRSTTIDELKAKFGEEIVNAEKIVVHDCDDDSMLIDIGTLPSDAPLIINKVAANASLLVAEGFIEPHFFAGYSGGRKSVLPGICGRGTVLGNHCGQFIASPNARTGILDGNPIQKDMAAAAKMAKLRYITNVVINGEKQVIAAFSGDALVAHEAGCAYLKGLCSVKGERRADIAVTSNGGFPLDQNIYQSVKGMTAAEAAVKEGGAIIICSACSDGAGGDSFFEAMRDCASPEELLDEISKVPMEETKPDQWEYQILARILRSHRVIIVCDETVRSIAEQMKLEIAPDVQAAFDQLYKGGGETVTVIPDGVSVVVECES